MSHSHSTVKAMAVIRTSPSPTKNCNTKTKNKKQKTDHTKKKTTTTTKKDNQNPIPSPIEPNNPQPQQLISSPTKSKKRVKSPGIRLVGARIYDSEHGKTCHQCRQKTMDFVVSCKSQAGNKQCTFRFCHKCLLNRYGEKAEELAELGDWECPKCRGVCNCSFCMKKRGFHPTGILVHTAKANGFSSVSDMLHMDKSVKAKTEEGASSKKRAAKSENENLEMKRSRKDDHYDQHSEGIIKDASASSKKLTASAKEPAVGPERRHINGSALDGNSDSKSQLESLKTKTNKKDTRKTKLERLRESEEIDDSLESSRNNVAPIEKITTKKCRISNEEKISTKSIKIEDNESEVASNVNMNTTAAKSKPVNEFHQFKKTEEVQDKDSVAEIPLPRGTELTNLANIDMPAEDVGHALQFLEFCEAFGKVLDLKKGQPEMLLRDLACDRRSRRKDESSVVQFHIKLLSMIQDNSGKEYSSKARGRNLWLEGLRKCISESHPSKELLLGFLDVGPDGYEQLNTSKKLRLLTFLCDEALSTTVLRSWIDEQNSEFVKEAKKAKEMVTPTQKDKDKDMKRKVQNEVARAILMNNGVPLSISEHEKLVLKIKAEAAQTLAETLEETEAVTKTLPKENPRSDAVRLEPVLFDASGRIFWKLRGYAGSSDILVQDIGNGDLVTFKDRWFSYDVQEKETVEKYLSSLRNL